MEREKELADIVCIFTSPEKPGIMFYDRTPEPGSPVAKFVGSVREGKYITDLTSISVVEWDNDMNDKSGNRSVMFREGSVNVRTIIVSEEQMNSILGDISRCDDPNRIVIDTQSVLNDLHKIDRNRINYDNFKKERDKVINSIGKYNKIDSDIVSLNNVDTGGRGLR